MSFRSDKIKKHAMLTKVAHKYSAMQKKKKNQINKKINNFSKKTLKDEALKMQQYIRTSQKGVSTKWFLCRGKGD